MSWIILLILFTLKLSEILFNFFVRKPSFNLIVKRPTTNNGREFYFISGMRNQASEAFKFMEDLLRPEDGIYLLNFRNSTGYNVKTWVKQLTEYFNQQGTANKKVAVSISVGDQVAYTLFEQRIFTQLYSINPCTSPQFLQPKIKALLTFGAPFLSLIRHLLGILSNVPIISADGGRQSIKLLADELWAIRFAPHITTKPEQSSAHKIILSAQDEFLANHIIANSFGDPEIQYVNCAHARTIGEHADKYRSAMQILLE